MQSAIPGTAVTPPGKIAFHDSSGRNAAYYRLTPRVIGSLPGQTGPAQSFCDTGGGSGTTPVGNARMMPAIVGSQ